MEIKKKKKQEWATQELGEMVNSNLGGWDWQMTVVSQVILREIHKEWLRTWSDLKSKSEYEKTKEMFNNQLSGWLKIMEVFSLYLLNLFDASK